MKKISIIYWSNTGNTEMMAKSIAEGATNNKTEVKLLHVKDATTNDYEEADVVAFGCPAMGVEEIEDTEMAPFIDGIKDSALGKETVLFGSYGWGDGTWIEDWKNEMEDLGSRIISESLILNDEPKDSGLEQCYKLGEFLRL